MSDKNTPSNCKLDRCASNSSPPREDSQECVACPHLVNPEWVPKAYKNLQCF